MGRQFTGSDQTPNIVSNDFTEAMWEMLIALGTAAGICIGVISLAAHLNETQKVRDVAENSTRAVGSREPAPLDRVPRPAPNVGEAEEGERGAIRLRMISPI
jgi:hypothetical protein